MTGVGIIGLAVALAMDAFAVSIATGAFLCAVSARQFFRLSWHFGFFQTIMPVIGWYSGMVVHSRIDVYGYWVAFGLLMFIGTGMLRSAVSGGDERRKTKDPTRGLSLVMLSIATSVDALAAGLSLSVLKVSIILPAIIIGVTAAGFTLLGLYFGSRSVKLLRVKPYAEIFGGVILYAIGAHILYQHGVLEYLK